MLRHLNAAKLCRRGLQREGAEQGDDASRACRRPSDGQAAALLAAHACLERAREGSTDTTEDQAPDDGDPRPREAASPTSDEEAQATKATAEAEQMEQLADWGGLSRAMAASAKRWLCACPAEGCGGAICAYGQECEVCGSVSRSCTECGRKAYQPGTQRMRCNTCGAKNPFE